MVRLTQKQVLSGINHSRVYGKHKLEKSVNVVGPNVRARDLNKKGKLLDTESDLAVQKGEALDITRTAENEFMASSSDMRGKQKSKTFRGARTYDWQPTRDFRPDAVGDVRDGGAFKGRQVRTRQWPVKNGTVRHEKQLRRKPGQNQTRPYELHRASQSQRELQRADDTRCIVSPPVVGEVSVARPERRDVQEPVQTLIYAYAYPPLHS